MIDNNIMHDINPGCKNKERKIGERPGKVRRCEVFVSTAEIAATCTFLLSIPLLPGSSITECAVEWFMPYFQRRFIDIAQM
jgi:hypothetical protein